MFEIVRLDVGKDVWVVELLSFCLFPSEMFVWMICILYCFSLFLAKTCRNLQQSWAFTCWTRVTWFSYDSSLYEETPKETIKYLHDANIHRKTKKGVLFLQQLYKDQKLTAAWVKSRWDSDNYEVKPKIYNIKWYIGIIRLKSKNMWKHALLAWFAE